MEIKINEATSLRPEGDRVLHAPLVEMDLNRFIQQLKAETTWTESDRNSITIFKSDHTTIVLIGLHEKAEMKKHTANGCIHVQVLKGMINFRTEQQDSVLEEGQMIVLQENIPHSVTAMLESFFLLTMMSNK